jgi:MATE family multidrug resistance protein
MLGFTSIVNTFVSQHYGAGKPRDGVGYVWTGLWMMLASWLVLMLPAAALMPWYFGLFSSHSEELRSLETTYAGIVILGSLVTMMGRTLAQFFYGIHRPNIVMVAAITGNLVNAGLNYVLIFGEMGFPRLGIAGAAIATVCGGAVELSIPLVLFLGPKMAREFGTRLAWRPSLSRLRDIVRLGWPAGAMWVNEIICWNILMTVLIGHFGELHNTAGWIALGYMHLSFMPAVGMSIAMTAIVGKCMGAGRPDLAAARTWLGLKVTLGYMTVCAVVFVVFREPAIALFIDADTSPEDRAELIRIGSMVMIAAAVFQLFDALGITLSGALRGAGDTVWPGVVTIVNSWVTIVAFGFFAIHYLPGLGSLGPWIGASLYIMVLGVAFLSRFLGGKWKTMSVVRNGPVVAAASS